MAIAPILFTFDESLLMPERSITPLLEYRH